MHLSGDDIATARNMQAVISERLETPKDWYGSLGYQNKYEGNIYAWFHRASRIFPSTVGTFDSLVDELYPQHGEAWAASGLRLAVAGTKTHRTDIKPTIEYIEGWLRRPSVWNDVSFSGNGEVTLDSVSMPGEEVILVTHTWSMMCRATSTPESPLPSLSIRDMRHITGFSMMRDVSGVSMETFIDAAVKSNYDPAIADVLTEPKVDAITVHKFCNQSDPEYGNPFLWMAAVSLGAESQGIAGKSHIDLIDMVGSMVSTGLSAQQYISWYRMGVPTSLMTEFSSNGIDDDMIRTILNNSPEAQ